MAIPDELSLEDLLHHMSMSGTYHQQVHDVLARKHAGARAKKLGIEVSKDECLSAVEEFRDRNELADDTVFKDWLELNHMTTREFEHCIECDILITKMPPVDGEFEFADFESDAIARGYPETSWELPMADPFASASYTTPVALKPSFNPYVSPCGWGGLG